MPMANIISVIRLLHVCSVFWCVPVILRTGMSVRNSFVKRNRYRKNNGNNTDQSSGPFTLLDPMRVSETLKYRTLLGPEKVILSYLKLFKIL